MSGTSLDAVDAVVADFDGKGVAIMAHASRLMPAGLRAELLALHEPGVNELHRAALAANQLADLYTEVVRDLLQQVAPDQRDNVRAIGAHGQTVRHQPRQGYTVQLNAPARLAERVKIPVVADFRSRDIAAGGQGAPLVPAFHHAVFAGGQARVVLNLGGIANISILPPRSAGATTSTAGDAFAEPVTSPQQASTPEALASSTSPGPLGFDTGPANMLLDLWCERHTGQPYDHDGQFARQGQLNNALLNFLLASEPWLAEAPPKSTGRDLFNAVWLDRRLQQFSTATPLSPADIQATLVAFSAETAATAIRTHAPEAGEVFLCGGGAHNPELVREITARLPGVRVATTQELGIPPQHVEALAFAWLARAHVHGVAGNVPAVTGAAGFRILGAYYPA